MVQTFDAGENALGKMNVLRAVRWGIRAWESDVMPGTIQNCWARSQAINFGSRPINSNVWSESSEVIHSLQQGIEALRTQGQIQEAMDVRQFIDPFTEQIQEDQDAIIDQIVARRGPEVLAESDEEEENEVPYIKDTEALSAIQALCRYQEQQLEADYNFLRILRIQEREVRRHMVQGLTQGTLNSWLN